MKLVSLDDTTTEPLPAAFGRLCVETIHPVKVKVSYIRQPPSGGCVLKHLKMYQKNQTHWPAAFGRLCVETINW